jgi:hypothetical protein
MLIGINGALGSGKDTAYKELVKAFPNLNVIRDAFADRLKVSAARALGFEGGTARCVEVCNQLKEEGVITVRVPQGVIAKFSGREYLQWYGTEAHREVFDYDFWIDAVLPGDPPLYGRTDLDYTDILAITDTRFPNEAEAVRARGGFVYRINREGTGGDGHASEQPLPSELVDFEIDNNGSLEDLRTTLKQVTEPLYQGFVEAWELPAVNYRPYDQPPKPCVGCP